jgi:V/A-type H+/Na+-transporting ATPase subunit I
VFFSFCLFFAMIIADAGYGLLLGGAVWLLRNKLDDTPAKRRVRRLGGALAVASMVYGVLSGAYFGVSPEPGTLLAHVHLIDSKDLSVMMPLSILIGVVHVGLGIGATGWRQRGSWQVLSSVGWGGMLLGGLLVGTAVTETGPPGLLEPAMQAGLGLLAAGGVLVLGFSSSRPWPPRGFTDVIGRIWDGIQSLTGITSAFGDVLSYLRLFALGLASTQLAVTFNTLAAQAAGDPALGVLLGALVFLIGHAFNFILAVLSGVVHGLRLNCIEFFKWSLPEEGYPFRPFSRNA